MDWDINSQLIDIQQYLLDVTAGHSVRFLMDFTIKPSAVDLSGLGGNGGAEVVGLRRVHRAAAVGVVAEVGADFGLAGLFVDGICVAHHPQFEGQGGVGQPQDGEDGKGGQSQPPAAEWVDWHNGWVCCRMSYMQS